MTGFRNFGIPKRGREDTGGSGKTGGISTQYAATIKTKGFSCRRNGRRHIIYRASLGHVSISRERKAIFVVKLEKNDNRHKTKDYEQAYRKAERT